MEVRCMLLSLGSNMPLSAAFTATIAEGCTAAGPTCTCACTSTMFKRKVLNMFKDNTDFIFERINFYNQVTV